MDCYEIEASYFEFTEKDSSRFQDILNVLDNMLTDKKLGKVKSRDFDKASIMVRIEEFETAFTLLQKRLSLHRVQDLISFRLIRDEQRKPKRTEYKITFGENGQTHS